MKGTTSLVLLAAVEFACASVHAESVLVNFDTVPALPAGPSIYAGQSPEVISLPGMASFTGGFVLGNPSNFPQAAHASLPNLYFTTSGNNGASPLSPIALDIVPALYAVSVSGTLFDGGLGAGHYTVKGFNGASTVATQNIILPQFGYAQFTLTAPTITRVSITDSSQLWNYLIDDVQITYVPEPSGIALAVVAIAWLFVGVRRDQRPPDGSGPSRPFDFGCLTDTSR